MILNLADDTPAKSLPSYNSGEICTDECFFVRCFFGGAGESRSPWATRRAWVVWNLLGESKGGPNPSPIERFLLEMRSVTGLFCWVPGLAFLEENGEIHPRPRGARDREDR
jgi:hypothetical protein